jgi:hypothetical protein
MSNGYLQGKGEGMKSKRLASWVAAGMVSLVGAAWAADWTELSDGGGIDGAYEELQTQMASCARFGGATYFGTTNFATGCQVWSYSGGAWTQVNTDGFGSVHNVSAVSMAVYDGKLFVGTTDHVNGCQVWMYNGLGWQALVGPGGLAGNGFGLPGNSSVSAMATFGGSLYLGTRNFEGCQVWAYDGDALTQWVGPTPTGGGFQSGFGDADNIEISAMADGTAVNGVLYLGTRNATLGCQLWDFTGAVFTERMGPLAGLGPGGLGAGFGYGTANSAVSAMATYDYGDMLLLGTDAGVGGCQVWTYDPMEFDPFEERVGPGAPTGVEPFSLPAGFGYGGTNARVASMVSADTMVLIGTASGIGGEPCQVWNFAADAFREEVGPAGVELPAGFGMAGNIAVPCGCFEAGVFHLGTRNAINGCQAWSYAGPGTWASMDAHVLTGNNNEAVSVLCPFGDVLVAGTRSGTGCQVWEYDDENGWAERVGIGGDLLGAGFGCVTNTAVCAFAEHDGTLYAGTESTDGGGELWQYDGTAWTAVATGGLGDADNTALTAMVAGFGDALHLGTRNEDTGGEVWRYVEGVGLAQVNADGFGSADNTEISAMVHWDGQLVAATKNESTGCEVWAYDGTDWAQINADGFGSVGNTSAILAVFSSNLYAAAANDDGLEVWRYNGTAWTHEVGTFDVDGIWAANVAGQCGFLRFGVRSGQGAVVLMHEREAWNWSNTPGFGKIANTSCTALAIFNNRLVAGTMNRATGCEIWRMDSQVVAVGSQVEFAAADVEDGQGGFLAEFTRTPKTWVHYNDPKAFPEDSMKKASLGIVTKLAKGETADTVSSEWKKKLCLYDKKAFKAGMKAGEDCRTFLLNNLIWPLWATRHLKTTEGGVKLDDQTLWAPVYFLPPEIAVVADGEGDAIVEAALNEQVVVHGKWFGGKAPGVWLEYVSKGAVKAKKLKAVKPYEYANAKGKDGASCMDTTTGISQVTVQMPAKWPKDWDHDADHNLVIDNGIGLATVPFGTVGAAP